MCLEDLLRTGIRPLAVADDHAETARGEIELALVRDWFYCASQSYRVIRPPPARTGQRETSQDRLVDVGKIDRLHRALRRTRASKDAKIRSDLLFEIEPEPIFSAKTADIGSRRCLTSGRAQRNRVKISAEPAVGQPVEEFELARL